MKLSSAKIKDRFSKKIIIPGLFMCLSVLIFSAGVFFYKIDVVKALDVFKPPVDGDPACQNYDCPTSQGTYTPSVSYPTIKFWAVICDSETDLPNLNLPHPSYDTTTGKPINGGLTITEAWVKDWVSQRSPRCRFGDGWVFGYGPGTASKAYERTDPYGPNWTTLNPTSNGVAVASIDTKKIFANFDIGTESNTQHWWVTDFNDPIKGYKDSLTNYSNPTTYVIYEPRVYASVMSGPGTYADPNKVRVPPGWLPDEFVQFSQYDNPPPGVYGSSVSSELRCYDNHVGYDNYDYVRILKNTTQYDCVLFTAYQTPPEATIDVNPYCDVGSWSLNKNIVEPTGITGSGSNPASYKVNPQEGTSYNLSVQMKDGYVLDGISTSDSSELFPNPSIYVTAKDRKAFNIQCHKVDVPQDCKQPASNPKQCPEPYLPGTYTETTSYSCPGDIPSTTSDLTTACKTAPSLCPEPTVQPYSYTDISGVASCDPGYAAAGACDFHCPTGQSGDINVVRVVGDAPQCSWLPWKEVSNTCTPINVSCPDKKVENLGCPASTPNGSHIRTTTYSGDSCTPSVSDNNTCSPVGSCLITKFPNDNVNDGQALVQWESDANTLNLSGGPFNNAPVQAPNGSFFTPLAGGTTLTLTGNGGQCTRSAYYFGPVCIPSTSCSAQGATCGEISDGCKTISCGGPCGGAPVLTATPAACGTGQVNLSWTPVPGALYYRVDRGGQGNYLKDVYGLNTTDDVGLSAGWRYDVAPVFTSGLGTYSNPAGATSLGECTLGAINVKNNTNGGWTINPGNLKGTGNGSVNISPDTVNGTTYWITADPVTGYDFPPTITNDLSGGSAMTLFSKSANQTFTLSYSPTGGGGGSAFDYSLSRSLVSISGPRGGSAQNLITKTLISPSKWVKCADENGTCSFSGTQQVRYGANGIYKTLTITNGTECSNAVFGDPVPGVVKSCDIGNSQQVSLTATDIPGISYSFSGDSCAPTCFSSVLFTIGQSAPLGDHLITVTGSPLNKTTLFHLDVTSSNDVQVACSASSQTTKVGVPVTLSAHASGGSETYSPVTWSGNSIPTNPAPTDNPYTVTYSTAGAKIAQATVHDTDGKVGTCTITINVSFNPKFEEF